MAEIKEVPIIPVGNRLLVRIDEEVTDKTSGGLYLPVQSQERVKHAYIAVLGDGEEVAKYKVGQCVIYDKYQGTEYEDTTGKYLILNECDIMAIKKEQ